MTVEKISQAYGISIRTVLNWKARGLTLADFRNPQLVAQRLAETARNRSPKLEAIFAKKNQLHIAFRLALAGANQTETTL
jgi:hypothetical protein